MSEVRVNNLTNENNTGGPTISGITTYSGRHFFVPPQGDTASRPEDCEPGSLRFNTDSAKLEYFRGNTIGWTEIEARQTSGIAGRGLFSLGYNPSTITNSIDFITIATTGNAINFGDTIEDMQYPLGAVASPIRGVCAGGLQPSAINTIQYVTISTAGNAVDFGDLTGAKSEASGCSNAHGGL